MHIYSVASKFGVPALAVKKPRMAFVVDALVFVGGAERVLFQALQAFPGTPVYTLIYNPAPFSGTPLAAAQVQSSFLDRLPGARWRHRAFFPLYPLAVESLDLNAYDLVVSFSYAVSHGVLTRPDQLHLALFYTPLRQAYALQDLFAGGDSLRSWLLRRMLRVFRSWDALAASRPDQLLAISNWVAGLVWCAYHRPARVLYPPVEVERFRPAARRGDFYLSVARMQPHKRLDLLVEAFNRLNRPLLLVGDGSQRKRLQKMAGPNIRFLGRLPDPQVAALLGQARAFVHAGAEDFGITLVEAQAAGCPVIAYQEGGASETVIPGHTGLLFSQQSVEGVVQAVLDFETLPAFSAQALRSSAERFSAQRFRENFAALLGSAWRGEMTAEQLPIGLDLSPKVSLPRG